MTRKTSDFCYPLGASPHRDLRSASGKALDEIDLESVVNGAIYPEDVHISSETLIKQAKIARQAGYDRLAANLNRAAELVRVPDDELLKIYEALRPYRSNYEQLFELAEYLERKYSAVISAQFIREAAEIYRKKSQ